MRKMNKKPPVFVISAVLLYLVLFTTTMTFGLYARYTATGSGSDGARVAKFEFVSKDADPEITLIDVSEISAPGDRMEYSFTVANFDGDLVCEVAQEYTIKVQADGNMPLVCTLTRKEGMSYTLETYKSEYSLSLSDALSPSEKQEHEYTLIVEWPSTENSADLANGMALGKITLTITSQQTD